jgi:hypothetical protein
VVAGGLYLMLGRRTETVVVAPAMRGGR